MDPKEIQRRIQLGRSFITKFGDEEGVDQDYATDQDLKKPQPPLTKAPMSDRIWTCPRTFLPCLLNKTFSASSTAARATGSTPRSLCPFWSYPICSGAPRE